jgi:hypothetical protein
MLTPGVPDHNLGVRYRGSLELQALDIVFVAVEEPLAEAVQAWAIAMSDAVTLGAAGGALFDPRAGAASVVHHQVTGRRGEVRFAVAGVAPRFLRVVIESLAWRVGPLESVWVQGSLAPDGGEASVQTDEVRRWLAAGRDYPERWSALPFQLEEGETGGLAIRVDIEGELEAAQREAFFELLFAWRGLVATYADPSGAPPGDRSDRIWAEWPRFGFSKREARANFPELVHAGGPSAALLVNMLCRFSAACPVRVCEIKT